MPQNKATYNIICFSNQLWDFPNWTNKRHVMGRLAEQGHTVLFVDPPINCGKVFLRQILRGHWGLKRLLFQTKKDPCGAIIFTPVSVLPFKQISAKIHATRIKKLAQKIFAPQQELFAQQNSPKPKQETPRQNSLNSQQKTLMWAYHVEIDYLPIYLDSIHHDFLIYDCVDNYEGFPGNDTEEKKAAVRAKEKYLATRANVVFASAPGLVDKLKQHNKNVYFTPNVGDFDKFYDVVRKIKDIPSELEVIPRPRVGFAGALDEYKFDIDLMSLIAEKNPHISFVLIGQNALKDKDVSLSKTGLEQFKNIYFLGQKPYEILEKYYAGFDGYIIPYKLNEYTVGGCFPVKFHDALAAGLPVVVTDLPAYLPFKAVSYICKTDVEFALAVQKSLLENDASKIKERQKVAKENNWNGKVAQMLDIIEQHL